MKILIVDDDPSLLDALTIGLQLQWSDAEVLRAVDGAQGVRLFAAENPDLTLLDVSMPRMNGWEALHEMRRLSDAPIIMLTAQAEEMARVKGLSQGADDYLTKPFSPAELFARMKAVLRRTQRAGPARARPSFMSGDLEMNFESHEVSLAGTKVKLTPKEYKLLYLLVSNSGRIVPCETLLSKVWGDDYQQEIGYLKTYVSRLRRKLGDDTTRPRFIATERNLGYRFVRPQALAV